MNAEELVKEAVEAHGMDGLCNQSCGCGLEDFAPCGHMDGSCELAKKITLPEGFSCDEGDIGIDGAGDYYVPAADYYTWLQRITEWKEAQK